MVGANEHGLLGGRVFVAVGRAIHGCATADCAVHCYPIRDVYCAYPSIVGRRSGPACAGHGTSLGKQIVQLTQLLLYQLIRRGILGNRFHLGRRPSAPHLLDRGAARDAAIDTIRSDRSRAATFAVMLRLQSRSRGKFFRHGLHRLHERNGRYSRGQDSFIAARMMLLLLLLLEQCRNRIQQLHLLCALLLLMHAIIVPINIPHTTTHHHSISAIESSIIQRGQVGMTRKGARFRGWRIGRARYVRLATVHFRRCGWPGDGSFELEQKVRTVGEEGTEDYFSMRSGILVQQPNILQPDLLPSLDILVRNHGTVTVQFPQYAIEHVLLHFARRRALVPRHGNRTSIDGGRRRR
mmetsp:Transcript_13572/g.29329  ORF Transcript_13572/g.29329 Transcript_13572/m.29329 type:complete len:352 (-) Transcript_13572:1350-2405(-)